MDTTTKIQGFLTGIEHSGIQVSWLTAAPDYAGSERDSRIEGSSGFNIAGLKEWEPGERLDHRTTARTGWRTQYTLLFEESRELTVFVLAEDSPSVDYGMVSQTKKELSARLLAWVLSNAACMNDLAGYALWSGDALKQFRRAEPAGRQVWAALNGYLDPDAESDETEASSESGLGKALLRLPTDRRCLVFVISDGLSRKPEDTEALEIAAAIHDVVFLVVGDMRERELPGKGFGFREIEDISSGQVVGIMLSDKTRKRWREGFDLDRRKLREHLENLGISMEEFFTHESSGHFAEKLLPILAGYRP